MSSIQDNIHRALFCLMRVTGAKIEEIVLPRGENVINDEDAIYIRFGVTKTSMNREVSITGQSSAST